MITNTSLLSKSDVVNDTFKDNDSKGILWRFLEIFDDELLIYNQKLNNFSTEFSLYKEHAISLLSLYFDKLDSPVFSLDETIQRKIIQYSFQFHKYKGSINGYNILFNLLKIKCNVELETRFKTGFDTGQFDSTGRIFDTNNESTNIHYSLMLYGLDTITQPLIDSILKIVEFNQPLGAFVHRIKYQQIDINFTFIGPLIDII